jgi:hypothetical protein
MTQGTQFIRRASLVVASSNTTIDLSDFRFTFKISAADVESPNNAAIRVYNLDPDTLNQVVAEFQSVIVQGGYAQSDQYGIIFTGTIKQFRKGRESATDTYLDILAGDADTAYNWSLISTPLAKGSTPQQQIAALSAAMNLPVDQSALKQSFGGTLQNPRGKVLFGMARNAFRGLAERLSCSWSIQQGVIQIIPYNGYLLDQPVVLGETSGVIGIPEATNEGIKIKVLLNPLIKPGQRVQIANALINQTLFNKSQFNQQGTSGIPFNQRAGLQFFADTGKDGMYRAFSVEHEGDTRGHSWYTELICLAIDPTNQTVIVNPVKTS